MHASPDSLDTRQRLLETAGEVFAEKGFRAASVREICEHAKANIAAVHYHFGDKEKLYSEVLVYAHRTAKQTMYDAVDACMRTPFAATAEQQLAVYIHAMVTSMLDQGRPSWQGKLMAREMIEPTGALEQVVELEIRPKFAMLRQIVAAILGVQVEHPLVRWYSASVVAQCLFFFQNREITRRLYPDLVFDKAQIAEAAGYMTRFSLVGLKGLADEINASSREHSSSSTDLTGGAV